jgi:hypothetical protein
MALLLIPQKVRLYPVTALPFGAGPFDGGAPMAARMRCVSSGSGGTHR